METFKRFFRFEIVLTLPEYLFFFLSSSLLCMNIIFSEKLSLLCLDVKTSFAEIFLALPEYNFFTFLKKLAFLLGKYKRFSLFEENSFASKKIEKRLSFEFVAALSNQQCMLSKLESHLKMLLIFHNLKGCDRYF